MEKTRERERNLIDNLVDSEFRNAFWENKENKDKHGYFENSNLIIRCEGEHNEQFLSWVLDLLSGQYLGEENPAFLTASQKTIRSIYTNTGLELGYNALSNLNVNSTWTDYGRRWSSRIDDLLQCKFIIESKSKTTESNRDISEIGQNLNSPTGKNSRSSIINVEERIESPEKNIKSGEEEIVHTIERVTLRVNFFHLTILSRKLQPVKILLDCIIDKCREEIKDGIRDLKWVARNIKIAFIEQIRGGYTNSYLNGMNAIHLASFLNCQAFMAITISLQDGILNELQKLKLRDDLVELYDSTYEVFEYIRDLCKYSMETKTENSKEMPTQIAGRYGYNEDLDPLDYDVEKKRGYARCINYFVGFQYFWAKSGDCSLHPEEFLGYWKCQDGYSDQEWLRLETQTCWGFLPVDLDGESPLHHAVRNDDSRAVEVLIEFRNEANRANKKGQTPFHLAKSLKMVELLMEPNCYDLLPPVWKSFQKKDMDGNYALQNLLKNGDSLAERVLDYFITTNSGEIDSVKLASQGIVSPLDSEELIIQYNLEVFPEHNGKGNDLMMVCHKTMIECNSQLIYHPVSLVMTSLKWSCKSKLVEYLYPFIQCIFTPFLTWLMFCKFDKSGKKISIDANEKMKLLPTCTINTQMFINESLCVITNAYENISSIEETKTETEELSCIVPASISFICLISMVLFEIWQITRAPIKFFRKSENWLDLFLVLSTLISLVTLSDFEYSNDLKTFIKLKNIEEIIGRRFFPGISIFFAWFKIVLLLQNVPKAGHYIRIFKIVAKELLCFLLIYFPVIIAFGTCFFVLLPPETPSFTNIWTSGMKIFAMLVGEIDFDGLFINNEYFEEDSTFQVKLLQVVAICFLCFISIVISNLLTGLAIKEIDKLKSEAWQNSIKEKVDELIEDDNCRFNKIWNCFGNRLLKKLDGEKKIYLLPNKIIKEKGQGRLSKFWKSFSVIDKKFIGYVASNYVDKDNGWCSTRMLANVKGRGGRWTSFIGWKTSENLPENSLQKTDIKLPPELIKQTMDYLRKKEKEKRELAEKEERELKETKRREFEEQEKKSKILTSKDIREAVLNVQNRVQNNERILKAIAMHMKIDLNNSNDGDSSFPSLSTINACLDN